MLRADLCRVLQVGGALNLLLFLRPVSVSSSCHSFHFQPSPSRTSPALQALVQVELDELHSLSIQVWYWGLGALLPRQAHYISHRFVCEICFKGLTNVCTCMILVPQHVDICRGQCRKTHNDGPSSVVNSN